MHACWGKVAQVTVIQLQIESAARFTFKSEMLITTCYLPCGQAVQSFAVPLCVHTCTRNTPLRNAGQFLSS